MDRAQHSRPTAVCFRPVSPPAWSSQVLARWEKLTLAWLLPVELRLAVSLALWSLGPQASPARAVLQPALAWQPRLALQLPPV